MPSRGLFPPMRACVRRTMPEKLLPLPPLDLRVEPRLFKALLATVSDHDRSEARAVSPQPGSPSYRPHPAPSPWSRRHRRNAADHVGSGYSALPKPRHPPQMGDERNARGTTGKRKRRRRPRSGLARRPSAQAGPPRASAWKSSRKMAARQMPVGVFEMASIAAAPHRP